MKGHIHGRAYVLGNDIDTDQIIPALHLVYSLAEPEERKLYGRFALSGVPTGAQGRPDGNIPYVADGRDASDYPIVIAGSNFGCGSSREHAPFALREAGCRAVVATSFARIFYRNAVDGGFLYPIESLGDLTEAVRTGDEVAIDLSIGQLTNRATGDSYLLRPLGDVAAILEAGSVFEYARRAGFMKVGDSRALLP